MQEIKSIEDLEALRDQITTQRLRCKQKADYKKMGFWEQLRKGMVPLEEECNRHNEDVYKSLPSEVPVSPEIAQLLIALSIDNINAHKALDDKERQLAFKTAAKFLIAVVLPNPGSLASLALTGLKGQSSLRQESSIDQLLQRADKNMKEVLGSYRLSKKDDGSFVLKRGSWFTYYEEKVHSVGPMGNKVSTEVHFSALNNVGVAKKLLPAEQQKILDQFDRIPARSLTVGRWEGRWEREKSR